MSKSGSSKLTESLQNFKITIDGLEHRYYQVDEIAIIKSEFEKLFNQTQDYIEAFKDLRERVKIQNVIVGEGDSIYNLVHRIRALEEKVEELEKK